MFVPFATRDESQLVKTYSASASRISLSRAIVFIAKDLARGNQHPRRLCFVISLGFSSVEKGARAKKSEAFHDGDTRA